MELTNNYNNLISVIIPVYNVEKYLHRCIDSVINQTYKNLEIILIDDGSTDNSREICDEYAQKDNRIQVIHKQNGGVSSARNAGLDIATGKYIGFVDSDDYIEKDMYEFLYGLMKNNDADIASCSRFDFVNNKYLPSKFDFPKEGFLSLNEILQSEAWGFSIYTKLFNRNIINNIRFDKNLAIGEDFLFCFQVLNKSKKTIFKNIAKYYYYCNQNSVMQNKVFKEKFLNVINLYNYMIAYSKKNNLSLARKKFIRYKLIWIIYLLVRISAENNVKKNKYYSSFLIKIAKKNLHYIIFYKLGFFRKNFLLLSCINFSLASKIYRLILKIRIIK